MDFLQKTVERVVVGNRKDVKSVLDEFLVLLRSISQEVSARAVDDAEIPVRQTYFALCFGFHIEKFTQFDVSSCFNHVL